MASRRRSSAAKAGAYTSTHRKTDTLFLSTDSYSEHSSDSSYKPVSRVLSLYGINAVDLEATFHSNKTAFAEAIVDRYYRRERTKYLLNDREVVDIVDISKLGSQNEEELVDVLVQPPPKGDDIFAENELDEPKERPQVDSTITEGEGKDLVGMEKDREIDLFSYDEDARGPAITENVSILQQQQEQAQELDQERKQEQSQEQQQAQQETCSHPTENVDNHVNEMDYDGANTMGSQDVNDHVNEMDYDGANTMGSQDVNDHVNEMDCDGANTMGSQDVNDHVNEMDCDGGNDVDCGLSDNEVAFSATTDIAAQDIASAVADHVSDTENAVNYNTKEAGVNEYTEESEMLNASQSDDTSGDTTRDPQKEDDTEKVEEEPLVVNSASTAIDESGSIDSLPMPKEQEAGDPEDARESTAIETTRDPTSLSDGVIIEKQEELPDDSQLNYSVNSTITVGDKDLPCGDHPGNLSSMPLDTSELAPGEGKSDGLACIHSNQESSSDPPQSLEKTSCEQEFTGVNGCEYCDAGDSDWLEDEDIEVVVDIPVSREEALSMALCSDYAKDCNRANGILAEDIEIDKNEKIKVVDIILEDIGPISIENDSGITNVEQKKTATMVRFQSVESEPRESLPFHDAISARPSNAENVALMIKCRDTFRRNMYRVQMLLGTLGAPEINELKSPIEEELQKSLETGNDDHTHVIFLLVLYMELPQRDSMKLPMFVQLTKRVTEAVASPDIDEEVLHMYRMFIDVFVDVLAMELPFEVARSLIDAFVGLAFKSQSDALGSHLQHLLTASANRCNTVEEYSTVLHMVNSRVGEGKHHTSMVTTLLLRLFELQLSSVSMNSPFHELRSSVYQLVEASLETNFQFLKDLVDDCIKLKDDVVAHILLLFIAKLMIGYHRDDKVPVLQRRRCLRLLQIIAVPFFAVLNQVEKSCSFLQQYVSCFQPNASSFFKLSLFDLSSLDGLGKVDVIGSEPTFDEQGIRDASGRYMKHLDCMALHHANVCDLVLLMSLKHIARVREATINRKGLQGEASGDYDVKETSGESVNYHDDNRHNSKALSPTTGGNFIPQSKCSSGTHGTESEQQMGALDCIEGSKLNGKGSDPTEGENAPQTQQQDGGKMPSSADMNVLNGANDTRANSIDDDGIMRYARIVWRVFAATRGKGTDIEAIHPQLAQYLLIPPHKLSHIENSAEAEICYKVILYHICSDVYLSIWKTMTNVLYSTNDYSQLTSASSFLYSAVTERFEYLRYHFVRNLLVACLGDQCYMVRLTAVKILSELFLKIAIFEDCISATLMDKLLLSMRDVNWKVRLAATMAVLHYVRRSGIDIKVIPAVAAVAERTCDLEKEQAAVRDAVLSTLAYSFFSTGHPFMSQSAGMSATTVALTERFVKIILYKMSAFKVCDNQVERVMNHYRANFLEVEGKHKSVLLQGTPNVELKDLIGSHTLAVLEKWMNVLLDLFLLRRREGASFHVLAEVLCVLKLFGQVCPELFSSHLTYFLPYLKVDPEESFDVKKIDVMVLVCNLVAISSGYSRHLKALEHHVVQLASFDAPALTRAAIHLLVKMGAIEAVATICDESFGYLSRLRSLIQMDSKNSPEDIVKVISYNQLLKNAWNLGCVAEYADLSKIRQVKDNFPQRLFDLLSSMTDIFYKARFYNVSGMLLQSISRIFTNIGNICHVNFRSLKWAIMMLAEEAMVESTMMVLYQLLSTYGRLCNREEPELKNIGVKKVRHVQNEVFCCLGSFVEAFVNLVTMEEDYSKARVINPKVDLVMSMEICNMIVVNRLTNPEPLVPFVFCHLFSRDLNVQRISEQALKVLARNDPDIFLARLASSLQMLLCGLIVDSFVNSIKVPRVDALTPRRLSAKRKSLGYSSSDGGETSIKRRSNNSRSSRGTLSDETGATDCTSPSKKLSDNQEFILGYESEYTQARVRGMVRIFLEAVTSLEHIKKMVSIFVALLSACLGQEFRDSLQAVLLKHDIESEDLKYIRSKSNTKLPRLLMKQVNTAKNGDVSALVEYFTLLFIDMLSTVLDHVTFWDPKVPKFFIKVSGDITKKENVAAPEGVSKYRDSRMSALTSKMKQLHL